MSSGGQLGRNRALSLGSGRSSNGRKASIAELSTPTPPQTRTFEPCDATASMFLYAQETTVVVAHHDTLKIERRFSRHKEEVTILAVDNVSERGAGRLVISYDAGQTAIVWDLMTGDEVTRFASYNSLSVAAWMRNGNVAFGNAQGNVILFEPSTSEHISARTIDQMPITALAPAADCRTYAIGYQNGSILIASLQPRFTILHTLSTSRVPSPVVTLAWHASSSRQKSDMLATQTQDGDLRVWSIAKSPSSTDTAKVVRVLKRRDNSLPGPNWLAWSKNGRVVQYTEGETLSWDVRTKNVTWESVPTLEHVRGIAIYGPGATLFTLGRNNTCQQFDLNSPPVLVANVHNPANILPPSPPVSIEEQKAGSSNGGVHEVPISVDVSESDEDHMSPLARIAREIDHLEERQQYAPDRSATISPASSAASSTSRSSAGSAPRQQYRSRPGHGSVRSSNLSEHTLMSPGSSIHTRAGPSISSRDTYSQSSLSSSSQHSGRSGRSYGRPSRLRQEVHRSPEEKVVVELFKFTQSRLSDIPYSQPQVLNHKNMGPEDLRRQMLSTIFGWHGEVDDLIRDELNRHPIGSPSRLLLTKWLGDIDTDIMATSSESMTASDWMLLALSGIGGQASQQKVARAYVQRLLEKRDVHTAATIMIGMGDQNDAIEIYVSHKRYMEALILTCMVYPADWGRQTQLLRKWGEWAIQHSQQQLAIRCFSCTGADSTEPFPTPTAQQITFSSLSSSIPEMLSPPLSPPGVVPRGPQRSMAKTAALKLVTSFGDNSGKSKFFGPDDDRTPMAGVGTPIADSALSPSGGHNMFYGGQRSLINTPASARTATPGGFQRQRLPSIGEMPTDVTPIIKMPMITIPTPRDQTANDVMGKAIAHQKKAAQTETLQLNPTVYQGGNRAATASPMMQRGARRANPLPAPSPDNFSRDKQEALTRNGSRGRMPNGLQIQCPRKEPTTTADDMTRAELSANSNVPARWGPPAPQYITGSVSSISTGGRSHRSGKAGTSSPKTAWSRVSIINSLDAADHHAKSKAKQERQASRDRDMYGRGRSSSKNRKNREPSLDRGRSGVRNIKQQEKSPVPMSPDDLRELGAVGFGDEATTDPFPYDNYKPRARGGSQATAKPGSKNTSRVRRMSPEPLKYPDSRPGSRMAKQSSRRASPNPSESSRGGRGRSKARDGSVMRSPSSPTVPMSTEAAKYRRDEEDDLRHAQAEQESFRTRNRSTSQMRDKPSSRRTSPGRKHRDRSTSRAPTGRSSAKPEDDQRRRPRNTSHTRTGSDLKTGDIAQMKTERQLKRENAARELEERRRSLARRPEGGTDVLHPSQISPLSSTVSRSELSKSSADPSPRDVPTRCHTVSPESQKPPPSSYGQSISRSQSTVYEKREMTSSPQIGLPATPKAMQHPRYDPKGKDAPDVPKISGSYTPNQGFMGSRKENEYNTSFENAGTLPPTTFAPPTGGSRTVSAGPGTADNRASISHNSYARYANSHNSMGSIDAALTIDPRNPSGNETQRKPPTPPPVPVPPRIERLQYLNTTMYSGSHADTKPPASEESQGPSSGGIEIVEVDDDNESENGGSSQPSPIEKRDNQAIMPPLKLGPQVYGQPPPRRSQSQSPQHYRQNQPQQLGQQVYGGQYHQPSQSLKNPPMENLDGLRPEKDKPPPVSKNTPGHSRGRSFSGTRDNSLTGRFDQATQGTLSASLARNTASPMEQNYSLQQQQQKIQQGNGNSPYESVPQQNQWGHFVDANGQVML